MPREVVGVEKDYDWGDPSTLRGMLGLPPARVAEVWYGTHPQGHSRLDSPDGPELASVTGEMTMLVKLLSCAAPLSLQTHPTRDQARRGFAREEAAGVARDATTRMYRDDSDKPEMLVALGEFEALCGFSPVDDALARLVAMGWTEEAEVLDQNGTDGYLLWAFDQRTPPSLDRAPEWLSDVASLHPHDAALRVAPLLNHVRLAAGEALALPAGNLHAYLRGTGLEVMASSDNVVRAGFTTKHVDVGELLRILDTSPLPDPVVRPVADDGTFRYASPSPAFGVARRDGGLVPAEDRLRLVALLDERPCRVLVLAPGEECDLGAETGWICTQGA